MKTLSISNALVSVICATALLSLTFSSAHADPVTGTWTTAVGQGNGPILNANTASPTIGDGTAESADAEMFHSVFPQITLGNSGDKIIFTGSVTLIGTANSPLTSGNPRTQFRFGLFDGDNVGPDDNGWVGYYMSNKHGTTGSPAGVLTRKPVGNTSVYLSTTGQSTALASVQGDGTAASLFNDDTYSMSLTIERSGNNLNVSGLLTGLNGFSQSLSGTDTTASTLGTYAFDYLGFLLGGNLDTDQAQFSNLDVTFVPVPEPSTIFLLSAGLLGFLIRAWSTRPIGRA
jgi:hypothetical protein